MNAAQRERWAQLIALSGLVAVCWWYVIDMSQDMSQMGDMHRAITIGQWSASYWLMMLMMWAVMMTAMMVPTAIRAIMIFARIGAQTESRFKARVPTFWFVSGYIVAWGGFSTAATVLQWALDLLALLSPMMVVNSPVVGALLLAAAGLWQLSPWKNSCLRHCQSPAMFMANHHHPGALGAMRTGIVHGFYCVGCCWALMILLFLGGVMNILWILIITIFVLIEKLAPPTQAMTRITGWLMILIGAGYLVTTLLANSN
jgi:predicted metal-binding membrane protein